eukprot:475386-Alexandrium_andersonii.AAC.1
MPVQGHGHTPNLRAWSWRRRASRGASGSKRGVLGLRPRPRIQGPGRGATSRFRRVRPASPLWWCL